MTVDETVHMELFQVAMFQQLGVRRDLAVKLVDEHVDWHEVDRLLKAGCPLDLAVKIAR